MHATVTVNQAIINALTHFTCDEFTVYVPHRSEIEIDKKAYTAVSGFLKKYRGEWKRSIQGFVFPFRVQPFIDSVVERGVAPKPNPLALHPTSSNLAWDAASLAGLDQNWGDYGRRVLEPNGGTGAILDVLRELQGDNGVLHTCELDPLNRATLEAKSYQVVGHDFLEYSVSEEDKYDVIVMNPPFSVKGDPSAWVTHVEHALTLLKPRGKLVGIAPRFSKALESNRSKEHDFIARFSLDGSAYSETIGAGEFVTAKQVETTLFCMSGEDDRSEFAVTSELAVERFSLIFDNDQRFTNRYEILMSGSGVVTPSEPIASLVSDVIKEGHSHDCFLPMCYFDDYCGALMPAQAKSNTAYDDAGQALLFAA